MGIEVVVSSGNNLLGLKDLLPHQATALLGCQGCEQSLSFVFTGSDCAIRADLVREQAADLGVPAMSRTLQREKIHDVACTPEDCAPVMDVVRTLVMDALRQ